MKLRMAYLLRKDMDTLIQIKDQARAETWKFYEEYEKCKASGNEAEADSNYKLY